LRAVRRAQLHSALVHLERERERKTISIH
jgi:hypothetical protein